jgi:hypothetical protein
MEKFGTYRGYEISGDLQCDSRSGTDKWHASIQINLAGKVPTEPRFAVQPPDDNPGSARARAIRVAIALINERPNLDPISEGDVLSD